MTLYLSKIEVDFPTARRLALRDDYCWHKALWQAFPKQPDKQRDFLTRVDRADRGFRAWLLSAEPPQPPDWGHWQAKEVAESFLSHHRYLFSLRANPTVKRVVRLPDGSRKKNGRREPILKVAELKSWLERQGREQGGFILDESKETGQPLVITKEPGHRLTIQEVCPSGREGSLANPQPNVRLNSVLFEGILVVTDREVFRKVFYGRTDPRCPDRIIRGIGSAKGFGFGLPVIVPRDREATDDRHANA